MGKEVLRAVLEDWGGRELDDGICFPAGEKISAETNVLILPLAEIKSRPQDYESLLAIEQVRDVVESLEYFLGRHATIDERLRAVLYYAENDAFIDPDVFKK